MLVSKTISYYVLKCCLLNCNKWTIFPPFLCKWKNLLIHHEIKTPLLSYRLQRVKIKNGTPWKVQPPYSKHVHLNLFSVLMKEKCKVWPRVTGFFSKCHRAEWFGWIIKILKISMNLIYLTYLTFFYKTCYMVSHI